MGNAVREPMGVLNANTSLISSIGSQPSGSPRSNLSPLNSRSSLTSLNLRHPMAAPQQRPYFPNHRPPIRPLRPPVSTNSLQDFRVRSSLPSQRSNYPHHPHPMPQQRPQLQMPRPNLSNSTANISNESNNFEDDHMGDELLAGVD